MAKAGWKAASRSWMGLAVDLLFPPRCLACGDFLVDANMPFCEECDDQITKERNYSACPRCAAKVAPFQVTEGRCPECRRRRLHIRGTIAVGSYDATLRRLVQKLKYRGQDQLEPLFGLWLAEAVRTLPWIDDVEAVVPVPTCWRHRIGRPLHAAEGIAKHVIRNLAKPIAPVLRRIRAGSRQVGLTYDERRRNIRGAFALEPGVKLKRTRLLLIDDVRTSGATLEECARVLLGSGAATLYAAVVARTPPHGRDQPESGRSFSGLV